MYFTSVGRMTFIDQMRFVGDRSLLSFGWQDYYRVPTVRSLVIRKRQVVGGKMQEEYIDIPAFCVDISTVLIFKSR